ncbi:MAG: hypothetical protein D3911_11700, partial [Candidatus Electrothrix sp. AW3_4]|nr:hypothetical protein [Candidatus Electrothrix gigas]
FMLPAIDNYYRDKDQVQRDEAMRSCGLVAQTIMLAAKSLGYEVAGGGSDANIFNSCGLPTAIIATGMTHVHSTEEQVSLADMNNLTALLLALAADPCSQL